MKNQYKDNSYLDEQLKQLDKGINWKEQRKGKLESKILLTMDSGRNKTKFFTGYKYVLSIGVLIIALFFSYTFLSDSITFQNEEGSPGNQGDQTNNNPVVDDKDEQEQENDNNDVNSKNGIEDNEIGMEVHTGQLEITSRKVEGSDQVVRVIHYQIEPYGISYQLDEVFGAPEVSNNQITYSNEYDDYKIRIEMIEHINLESAVPNLQARYETEGYEEKFELESTPLEENNFVGKMQFFGHYPVKGFIAYEIDEHALVITFEYPAEGGDGMYPLLEQLRKSIKVHVNS